MCRPGKGYICGGLQGIRKCGIRVPRAEMKNGSLSTTSATIPSNGAIQVGASPSGNTSMFRFRLLMQFTVLCYSCLAHGTELKEQTSMTEFVDGAVAEALEKDAFLGKTRFVIDDQHKTFFLDLRPVPDELVLSQHDPYSTLVEMLVRAAAFRRDLAVALPNERFWMSPVNSLNTSLHSCIKSLETTSAKNDDVVARCHKQGDEQFELLRQGILRYASDHKLQLVEPPTSRDPVAGYRVTIRVDPPVAKLRIMPLLEYKKYQYLKTPKDDYQWNDVLTPDESLIGWYRYRVEWPKELNGPEEGNFEIRSPSAIRFTPQK